MRAVFRDLLDIFIEQLRAEPELKSPEHRQLREGFRVTGFDPPQIKLFESLKRRIAARQMLAVDGMCCDRNVWLPQRGPSRRCRISFRDEP